ncbi:CaiB/BaiF CoA transferase family protein [Pacificimonas flava]|uniref:L-carnitine dehydratase/bile acid-inducible protein F n=1 Tax=Pacificimonas flava TaxID=1234595 RepID=M2U7B2_9SPHN|nr:CaiB/BaiF CoA-transferase family protein [Pacificimonas flava]EMD83883.1 L-carnitine dehydratase/bile acid-inducible protein F [Pacificimonas flava]MBB5281142.1 crotonobetainyl-CoA:carnitine CoA-transferase CaiB-like acyl-CoA transferase [Pacificimonas flava]
MTKSAETPRPAPLAGRRVLDLSRVLAGPWCTMILGDLGAEVVKVENPRGGDDTRGWGPPFAAGEAAYYLCANRNKKSLALDFSEPEGQAILRSLAADADILVENYKAGGLGKYGLDYASLAKVNPRLVYCSVTGYGHASPLAARPGYDYVIQAEGGLMSVTGPADGAPHKVGVAVADLFTGMAAAQACLAGLIAADRDGRGQHIDMALYDSQLAMLANVGSAYLVSGKEPARYGNGHATVLPYDLFDAADGQIVVAVGNDRQFRVFAEVLMKRPDLAADARFATNAVRVENRDALLSELRREIAGRPADYWIAGMRENGIPCGEVRSVGEALTAPETEARDMVRRVPHPAAGEISLVGSPLKFGATPVVEPRAPPLLGQHSDEILAGAGYNDNAIAALRADGIVGAARS